MRLSDAFLTWRDRVLSSPGFQRWAASFPLTRPLARAQERRLFDLVAGFVHSQVLSACVQLDLFSRLTQPQTPDALAQALTLPPDALTRLLDAAIALGLLETRAEGRVGLGMLGAALLGNPGAVAMIEHHALLYRDLADPVALLRGPPPGGTALARYWAYGTQEAGEVAAYSTLMAASNSLVSADILDAWPLAGTRRLLDIGGGEGVFLEAALRRAPALEGMLFDLPAVAARAEARLAKVGLGERVCCLGGDFRGDPVPRGADLISLVRVVHDHEDATVRVLLRAAREALEPGGTLLVAEPMAAVGAESATAYFLFYLLAMGSGRPRTPEALSALLHEAGFSRVRKVPTRRPLLVCLLAATP